MPKVTPSAQKCDKEYEYFLKCKVAGLIPRECFGFVGVSPCTKIYFIK